MTDELAHLPSNLRDKVLQLDRKREALQQFIVTLSSLNEKTSAKQELVDSIIEKRIQQHHALLEKWKERWKTTVAESIDEKLDKLDKQTARFERKILKIDDFRGTLQRGGQLGARLTDGGGSSERPKVLSRMEKRIDKWLKKDYELTPDGMNDAELSETMSEVEDDFNTLLSESKASLKRSLIFVGGIIRGYLRRGRNREFLRTLQRLEARSKEDYDLETPGTHVRKRARRPSRH